MVGFEGSIPSDNILRLIREYHIGGVILFGRNVQTPLQVRALIDSLQNSSTQTTLGLPLLVSIDQEGGIVTRLTRGFTIFPGNMALGAANSKELARQAAEVMAREMAAIGINMNLAPVLDINTRKDNPGIGVRSYGDTPELVARMGITVIEAYQQNGIIATAKHFPGKGDAPVDVHLDLPFISHPRARLEGIELYPFIEAIRAGIKAVMTSHVCFPGLEPDPPTPFSFQLPATFSRAITETLLRKELDFQGLVITDDLEMGAISKYFGLSETVVRAVEAGTDLLLICRDYQKQLEGVAGLYQAVETGRISEERISASFQRILKLKQEFCKPPTDTLDQVGTIENRSVAYEVARRAVTLVRDHKGLIPLNLSQGCRLLLCYPKVFSLTQVEEGHEPVTLLSEFKGLYPDVAGYEFDTDPSPDQIRQAYSLASEADFIVIGSYNSHLKPQQKQLIKELITLRKPLVLMTLRNPYDIADFPEIGTCLALYDYHKASIVGGIQVLLGKALAEGKLPVTL